LPNLRGWFTFETERRGIETNNFRANRGEVNAVAFHQRRGGVSGVIPKRKFVLQVVRRILVQKLAIRFAKAHECCRRSFLFGSRGCMLFVPTQTRPLATTGSPSARLPSRAAHLMFRAGCSFLISTCHHIGGFFSGLTGL